MRTVKEISELTGVSVRTLHYYDEIGLLVPSRVTEAGYRLYDEKALETLQLILLFRELEFSLKEIKEIIGSTDFDRNTALKQQIELLTLKKEHIDNLITLARGIYLRGVKNMDFSAFDASKIDEYCEQAKALYGKTEAFKEYEEKTKSISKEEMEEISKKLMDIFAEFTPMKDLAPGEEVVQKQVEKLQGFITANFYNCTKPILLSLGSLYSGGGAMTENIDDYCGKGTGEFLNKAIQIYCK